MTRKFNLRLSAMAAAAAVALAGGARASDVLFTITEYDTTITFTLPKSPSPSDILRAKSGDYFTLFPVRFVYNGTTFLNQTIDVHNTNSSGGIDNLYGSIFLLAGSQYYTGDESTPTFSIGSYGDQYDFITDEAATVKITDVSSVPEPAAWTLMLAGFGGLGGALRARRRRAVAV